MQIKYVEGLPEQMKIVSMIEHHGTIFVATEHSVFRLNPNPSNRRFEPIRFELKAFADDR